MRREERKRGEREGGKSSGEVRGGREWRGGGKSSGEVRGGGEGVRVGEGRVVER